MPVPSPARASRPLGAAIAVLLLAGVASAAVQGGDDDEAVDAGSASSTTLAPGAASPTVPASVGTLPDGTPDTASVVTTVPPTIAPGGSATTSPPTTAPPSSTAIAVPIIPPSGTYAYRTIITDKDGSTEGTATSTYERLGGDDHNGTGRQTESSDQGFTTNDVTISPTQVLVSKTVGDTEQGSFECEWEPAWTYLGAFAAGATFEISSVCHTEVQSPLGKANATITLSGNGSVEGTTTVDVNGVATPVWIVHRTLNTKIEVPQLPQPIQTSTVSTELIDPARGMPVQSDSTTTVQGEQQRVQTFFTGFTPK